MLRQNIILNRSFDFAKAIIGVYTEAKAQNEYVLSKQLLRSGTSIGANVEEAEAAYSKKEFAAKMSIALKEARETRYWLKLIDHTKVIRIETEHLLREIGEIIKILTAIIKTTQENMMMQR
ncbi:MAG: four helix bundle protein [Bacteroidia bacterium]